MTTASGLPPAMASSRSSKLARSRQGRRGRVTAGYGSCRHLRGNRFRLIVVAVYVRGLLDIRWVGTHAEYGKLSL
jgi:hypothetical protein